MGLDIGGNVIVKNGLNGVSLNMLAFNSAGQGSAQSISALPGYSGWKAGTPNTFYAAPTGWEVTAANWASAGLNSANGVFTCPVAGLYALGYNGIHYGGSGYPAGFNTYGYGAFAKNGGLSYFVHWNSGPTANFYWANGGQSVLFNCAAGDTLALFINRAPTQYGPDVYSQNMGLYPNTHGAVWCRLVG